MSDKVVLDFVSISDRLRAFDFPRADIVVGIADGGKVPAALVAFMLDLPLIILPINFRAPDNTPQRGSPELLTKTIPVLPEGARVLLVDDVSVTGQTFAFAKKLLKDHVVVTFALKGKADHVLFPEIPSCVNWPWKVKGG